MNLDISNTLSTPEALYPTKCGHRNDEFKEEISPYSFRVVSGTTARKGDYPWQVIIINIYPIFMLVSLSLL